MKDDRGQYYYPFPQNKKARMYVLKQGEEICFRAWNSDDPELWEKHGWVPYEAIKQAQAMYEKKNDFDPVKAYDLELAEALLKE
jgi:hypothetical protein